MRQHLDEILEPRVRSRCPISENMRQYLPPSSACSKNSRHKDVSTYSGKLRQSQVEVSLPITKIVKACHISMRKNIAEGESSKRRDRRLEY